MPRPIYEIAREIAFDWEKPYFGAVPYIEAMLALDNINEKYGYDSAEEIVLRFLVNASTYRGATARKLKEELKDMLRSRGYKMK